MTQLTFLPNWPFPPNPLALFGVLLLAGLVCGEFTQRVLKLPRITGYVVIGMALGSSGLNVLDNKLLDEAWIFVQIAIGLILFELGRRLDLGWLRRAPWLAATGVAESAATFIFIYLALVYFDVAPLYAAVAAAIGISTSPAVLMLVARDLKAEGQVTERALHLTAINSAIAFTLVIILMSGIHHEYQAGWIVAALHPIYLLCGALLLGFLASLLALGASNLLSSHPDRHYVLLLGIAVLAVGTARMLALPVPLSLLAFGVLLRHLDNKSHVFDSAEMGRSGQLFYVVLFVVTGAKLSLPDLAIAGGLAITYILARFMGKAIGVMSLSYFSGLHPRKAALLTLALTPMSGLALAMVQGTVDLYPEFGEKLAAIVLSAVIIMEIIGPIAVQFALRCAGEAEAEK